MNWIILLSIKEIKDVLYLDGKVVSLKLLFTDITLSSPFQKIEENIDISKINEIEQKIVDTNRLILKIDQTINKIASISSHNEILKLAEEALLYSDESKLLIKEFVQVPSIMISHLHPVQLMLFVFLYSSIFFPSFFSGQSGHNIVVTHPLHFSLLYLLLNNLSFFI